MQSVRIRTLFFGTRLRLPLKAIGVKQTATIASMASMQQPKKEGDISDAFASMAGLDAQPLPDKFRQIKIGLVQGNESKVEASWRRLLQALKTENEVVAQEGPHVIPEVRHSHLEEDLVRLKDELRKRGSAVIRVVIPEQEARAYKFQTEDYVRKNPQTKGFPKDDPQVFELYWSPAQIAARAHPNLLATQRALMRHLWHVSNPHSPISLAHPLTYADRLRIRQPGDAAFALGPHQDGGSVERWEPEGYGRGGVYDSVFEGRWEDYDAWDAGRRVDVRSNLYGGIGPCTMFRTFQGWLSMSETGPGKGTLLVNPLVKLAQVYALLRPFFRPVTALGESSSSAGFLSEDNWVFTGGESMTSDLQGATPGHGQELSEELHPHLELERVMVNIPDVKPGDYVVWHCDSIHAVDRIHRGKSDSSVMYIPVCPTTENNAQYLVRQREAFLSGTSGPDFGGGKGESEHVGRPSREDITSTEALQAMGLAKLELESDMSTGQAAAVHAFNRALGF